MCSTATVILLQHGEKVRDVGDVPLTALGHRQAERAAAALRGLAPAAVVSSPMLRARQTAQPVGERCGRVVGLDARLRERMNLEAHMSPEAFFEDWARTCEDRDFVPRGGDSSRATGARMLAAVETHARDGEVVVLATHGGATVDLLRTLLGDAALERRAPGLVQAGMPGAGLTTLRRTGPGWEVGTIASLDHLPAAERTGHRR